jgi:hypothetical protein
MTDFTYVDTAREVAEHLVSEIINVIEPGEIENVTRTLAEELDKYFEAGGLWR